MDTKSLLQHFLYKTQDGMCRTCLGLNEDMTHMTETLNFHCQYFDEAMTLQRVMKELTGQEIHEDESLPMYMCENCVSSAIVSFLFKKQSEKTFKALQNCVNHLSMCVQMYTPNESAAQMTESLTVVLPYKNILEYFKDDFREQNMPFVMIQNKPDIDEKFISLKNKPLSKSNDIHKKQIHTNVRKSPKEFKENKIREFGNPIDTNKSQDNLENVCSSCGKKFRQKHSFEKHILNCSKSGKQFECHACGKCFKSKQPLTVHIHTVHLRVRRFVCKICDKHFATKSNLKGHHVVHTRERHWTCDVCDKKFVDKKALKLHTRIHTGERPYECEQCGEKFLCTTRRKMHIQRKHMARNHGCEHCGAFFHTNNDVKNHIKRVHYQVKKRKPFGMGSQNIARLSENFVSRMLNL